MVSDPTYHGSLRWVPPEDGGLPAPFPSDHWCRPAWIESREIKQIASLVIENIVPNEPVSPNVTASWGAWKKLPQDEWTVRPGDVLVITDGPRDVAYFTVDTVDTVD